jgi:hypothetical protein
MIAQYIEEMERRYVVAHLMVYDCTTDTHLHVWRGCLLKWTVSGTGLGLSAVYAILMIVGFCVAADEKKRNLKTPIMTRTGATPGTKALKIG